MIQMTIYLMIVYYFVGWATAAPLPNVMDNNKLFGFLGILPLLPVKSIK
jgi:hypothetical protein